MREAEKRKKSENSMLKKIPVKKLREAEERKKRGNFMKIPKQKNEGKAEEKKRALPEKKKNGNARTQM
jgi:hypothetical protein